MKMLQRIWLCWVLIMLPVAPGHAGKGYIGVGSQPCSVWTEARKTDGLNAAQLKSWLMGYVSGMNSALGETELFGRSDGESMVVRIDVWCLKNPNQTVGEAAAYLVIDMAKEVTSRQR